MKSMFVFITVVLLINNIRKMIMYFTKAQASEYLKKLGISISENTLSKYITVGGGPEYFKFNRKVLYTQETLDKWVLSKLSKRKTSSSSC